MINVNHRKPPPSLKALLHYAFLACVLEENARDFALGNLQSFFLSDSVKEY